MCREGANASPLLLLCLALALTVQLLAHVDCHASEVAPGAVFASRGPGGGGGLYAPAISPYDAGLVLVATDMGGVFRSEDGGGTWSLIHFREGLRFLQVAPPPAFFPSSVAWVTSRFNVTVSRDRGRTWKTLPVGPWKNSPIRHLAALPGAPDVLCVSTAAGVWRGESSAGGDFGGWRKVIEGQTSELLPLGGLVYTMGTGGLMTSADRGATWRTAGTGTGAVRIDGAKVAAFTGGRDDRGVLLVASLTDLGMVRSTDEGATWERTKSTFENEKFLLMAPHQTSVVYAAQTGGAAHRQVLRSTDGGRTWEPTFRMAMPWDKLPVGMNVERSWVQTQLGWGYYITAKGLAVNPGGDGFLLLATQGDIYVSHDGGDSWRQTMTEEFPPLQGDKGPRLRSTGLEITSAWGYLFDPHDPQREYIAYTDIGFARSLDRGATWSWAARGAPWTNTFYDVVFDPEVPGRMYAAASMRHDIPHYIELTPTSMRYRPHARGGVVTSADHAASWTVPYKADAPGALPSQTCTTIALDERSPVGARVLYAGLFGEGDDDKAGVYRSEDGGGSWRSVSRGLGVPGNLHVYRVRVHPVTRDVYCLITGLRGATKESFFSIPGGLWKSTDGGESWHDLTRGVNVASWSTSFAFDPVDPQTLYVTAATAPGRWLQGGLYKTVDGGRSWRHVLTDGDIRKVAGGDSFEHTMIVVVHPDDPKLVYVGTTLHGLVYSRDGGNSWKDYAEFPFAAVVNVVFDPRDHKRMIVTTFGGGVWSGPYLPPAR